MVDTLWSWTDARQDGTTFEVVHFEPVAELRAGVRWLARRRGNVHGEGFHRVTADRRHGEAVRDAYRALPAVDPDAVPAWLALASEIEAQYRVLTGGLGVTVDVCSEDPYGSVLEAASDVVENGRLAVLATASTGGHPVWPDEVNDMFRAVHDAFGHLATGRGFDRHGEEAAVRSHAPTFSPLARAALLTETRGQNATMVWGDGGFPPEKVGLLPARVRDVGVAA